MTLLKDGQEVEMKLILAPDDAAKVARAPIVRDHARGKVTTTQLKAIYYDTPDLALKSRKVALRVRREGRRWVQCLKTAGKVQGGMTSRRELETVVPRPELDLTPLVESDLREVVPVELAGILTPVFETDIRRTSRNVTLDDGTVISLDLDKGLIRSGGAESPVSELELEIRSGDPRQLFAFARGLLDSVPVRLSVISKAGRGYALANGGTAGWSKSSIPALEPRMSIEDALATIIHACTEHLLANEPCVLARSHIEGVHQMRVATRRLRSALSLFKKLLPPTRAAHFNAELKWLINEMGPARDWDVFLDETLPPVGAGLEGEGTLEILIRRGEARRRAAYGRADAAILSPRYTSLLLDLGEWVQGRGWRDQPLTEEASKLFDRVGDLSGPLLHKRYRKVRKLGKDFEALSVDERHQVRIAMKKLRYATEFLSSLYPKDTVTPWLTALKEMQDGLGLMNDISVMRDMLEDLTAAARGADTRDLAIAAGRVIGWHEHVFRSHEAGMNEAWKAFVKAKPFWPEK